MIPAPCPHDLRDSHGVQSNQYLSDGLNKHGSEARKSWWLCERQKEIQRWAVYPKLSEPRTI